jgi:hypothetical protein
MMMPFYCSFRNKNRSRAPYTVRKVHIIRDCLQNGGPRGITTLLNFTLLLCRS